jgi:hypothetical protein
MATSAGASGAKNDRVLLQLLIYRRHQVVKRKAPIFVCRRTVAAAKIVQLRVRVHFEDSVWEKKIALHAVIALFCGLSAGAGRLPD